MKPMPWSIRVSVLVSILVSAACVTGCTTLGPMPATTGISAVPSGRPGVEAQVGLVPGYFLSAGTQEPTPHGDPISQVLGLVEPDRWLGTHGLIAGARHWGRSGDSAVEPFVGYRLHLDDAIALAVIGHGTAMRGENNGASYRATRVGGELAVDARLVSIGSWIALHGQAGASATYLDAHGTYCADAEGLGTDCNQDGSDRLVDGSVRGVFAAATASLAIELGRRPTGVVHDVRLALVGAAGVMPTLRDGVETDAARYASIGLTITLGLGADR
jgi:hypothetical protein